MFDNVEMGMIVLTCLAKGWIHEEAKNVAERVAANVLANGLEPKGWPH
jgi:hypothetical protein